jgi:hypothetical protein
MTQGTPNVVKASQPVKSPYQQSTWQETRQRNTGGSTDPPTTSNQSGLVAFIQVSNQILCFIGFHIQRKDTFGQAQFHRPTIDLNQI